MVDFNGMTPERALRITRCFSVLDKTCERLNAEGFQATDVLSAVCLHMATQVTAFASIHAQGRDDQMALIREILERLFVKAGQVLDECTAEDEEGLR